MNDYNFTLTATAVKKVSVRARSQHEANLLIQKMIENTDVLDFSENDIPTLDVFCEPNQAVGCEGDACNRSCIFCCESCGCCTEQDTGACEDEDCETCEWSCPECGSCMLPDSDEE